jgi:chromosome segregation ATPase
MSQSDLSREDLEETIASLREENARLKEEIRKIRRETNEVPPHYQ